MSDYEFESSPEDPWITEEGEVRKEASPGEKVDIESLANPSLQGDVPSPSPVKSRTPKKTDEEKWEEY